MKDSSTDKEIWERALTQLRHDLDPQIYGAYIEPLQLVSFDEQSLEAHLAAPSKLVCSHVDSNFREQLQGLLSELSGHSGLRLELSVGKLPVGNSSVGQTSGSLGATPSNGGSLRSSSRKSVRVEEKLVVSGKGTTSDKPSSSYVVVKRVPSRDKLGGRVRSSRSGYLKPGYTNNLNPKYTFSSYVVGNNNQFCHAACSHVAEDPGGAYNPLFIYSGVGLGKTHLLHAIGNSVLERKPKARVFYMSSETFTNELILALRFAKMNEFKKRFRNIEVLLIDDIQFMCGKESTQEEFFHTFNALYNAKHQIVITSDKLPQEIPGIEERLQTRFSWGLTADIQAPDFETRVAILNRKAAFDGFSLPKEVSHFIAEKVSSNVRELEGALTRLHAKSSLSNIPISLELTQETLKPLFKPKKVHITIDDIRRTVSDHFHIRVSEMISKRRTKNLSFPRHIAMFLCRKHTTASFPEIGSQFGGRDHSSVIHAANVITTKVAEMAEVRNHIDEIEQKLFE